MSDASSPQDQHNQGFDPDLDQIPDDATGGPADFSRDPGEARATPAPGSVGTGAGNTSGVYGNAAGTGLPGSDLADTTLAGEVAPEGE
jgi:hypothetical protein